MRTEYKDLESAKYHGTLLALIEIGAGLHGSRRRNSGREQAFLYSLLNWVEKTGFLTEKQRAAIDKIEKKKFT